MKPSCRMHSHLGWLEITVNSLRRNLWWFQPPAHWQPFEPAPGPWRRKAVGVRKHMSFPASEGSGEWGSNKLAGRSSDNVRSLPWTFRGWQHPSDLRHKEQLLPLGGDAVSLPFRWLGETQTTELSPGFSSHFLGNVVYCESTRKSTHPLKWWRDSYNKTS